MTAHVGPHAVRWAGLPLSTTSDQAAARYRDGVAALVAGLATSGHLLAAAVDADPDFVLAHVARAVSEFAAGGPYRPAHSSRNMQRGERQHVEIVNTALAGIATRAADLRREHLLEFPGDLLIVWLPVLQPRRDPEAIERTG